MWSRNCPMYSTGPGPGPDTDTDTEQPRGKKGNSMPGRIAAQDAPTKKNERTKVT